MGLLSGPNGMSPENLITDTLVVTRVFREKEILVTHGLKSSGNLLCKQEVAGSIPAGSTVVT